MLATESTAGILDYDYEQQHEAWKRGFSLNQVVHPIAAADYRAPELSSVR
jgi:hypothetical protein